VVEIAVPTAPPLARLNRVELVHTGQWKISTGQWTASRDDLVAAAAALKCPAVRRPVLKLGHSRGETPLWAGNPTGVPAVGWVDNLALTNQGHTLVGDFVGMPGWLGDIAASAYPDRSVEGSYDHRCQIGHTHPFVLTAVALLGVTPPGVGTLKSLQDVGALYGVQADAGTAVVAHLRGGHNQQTHGNRGRGGPGLPRVTLETSSGDLHLRADDVGDVDLTFGAAGTVGTTLTTDETQELVDGLDDLLDVDIPDNAASNTLIYSVGLRSEVELALYGNGLVTIGWEGDEEQAEIQLDPDDVEPVRDALQRVVDEVLGPVFAALAGTAVAAFDPDQPRDPRDGRWTDGPAGSILSTVLETAAGALTVDARPDGVHLSYGSNSSGALDAEATGKLSRLLNLRPQEIDGTVSAATYTPGTSPPTGFAQITPDGDGWQLELLADDTTHRLTRGEARQLADTVVLLSAAGRADTASGPVDVFLDGNQVGLRAPTPDGGQVDLRYSFADWQRIGYAINIVDEGFDEFGQTADPEADLTALRVDLPGGAVVVSRDGPPGEPGGPPSALTMRAEVGGWSMSWPNTLNHPLPRAFDNVEEVAEAADLFYFSSVRRSTSRGVTVAAGSGSGAPPLVQVAAASDVKSGAMVALLPSPADAERLATDGGEDQDQLHVTLLFLGDADAYPPDARQAIVEAVRDLAEVIPPGEVDGMALAAFNPHRADKDTAIVLELGGDGLEDVQGMTEAAVAEAARQHGLALPEQHAPYRPHLTLVYSDDLMNVAHLADRAGPVRMDRIRVAFAGENVDTPLSGEGSDLDVDGLTDDDMPAPAVEVQAQQSRRITRSDAPLRRYWSPAGKGGLKIRWNTPGDWTRCVRQLRKYVRDPKGLCSVYHKQFTGVYPGDRRNVGKVSAAGDVAAFDPDQPRDPRDGRWVDLMHPATPDEIGSFRERFGKSIPPAWTDVHLADDLDNAPLLVTGRDGKGRRQAIYSTAHTQGQAAAKFQRVRELNEHLDKLDHAVERDAATNDDAAALLLIRRLGMRPGSTRDTGASQQAYGATTLLARHVTVEGGTARFDFIGKKGVHIQLETADPVIVSALSRRLSTRTGDDRLLDTTEAHTRDYMHSTGVPAGFLLKDLRTVHANMVALREVAKRRSVPKTKREFQQRRREVAEKVSAALGNTPTLALSSYINPTVFAGWVRDPAWVAAAAVAGEDAAVGRAEEKQLLAGWFATVSFDRPATGIPAVDPDPDDEDDDGRTVDASEGEMTLPNPNPTMVHAAAAVSVDDVRTAYYAQAPDRAWIREFHTQPRRLIVANDGDGTVARVDFDVDDDGAIRFSPPVPVRVEYVEQGDDAERVAASRMVYASAAESRPDVEAHASHNQMTHGRRYGPDGKLLRRTAQRRPGGKASGGDRAIRGAYDALARGEGASIDATELDGLLKTLTGGGDEAKRANLARLDVGGYGTLFATDKTDALDRSKMPQLGTNEEEMRPFLDLLRAQGVEVWQETIDPTTLKPSQSEISGAKTGKLYGFMAKDGWLPGGLLVTSNDGYVVDGHHRWSGAAAVRASGARPDMTVTGLVVDRPIDEVLRLAASVAKFESLDFDRTTQASAADPHTKTPAAEPGNPSTEEDDMPLSNEALERLGLAEDADPDEVNAAVLALADKAEQPPEPANVAASLPEGVVTIEAATLEDLRSKAELGAQAAERQRVEDRDRIIEAAVGDGRIAPARRDHWAKAWEADPDGAREVLASLEPGLVVPVEPKGKVGEPQDVAAAEADEDERIFSKLPALTGANTEEN
jgi:DNA topoisomerase IB/2'-5' RNA ligase